jgi:hypothetical protein
LTHSVRFDPAVKELSTVSSFLVSFVSVSILRLRIRLPETAIDNRKTRRQRRSPSPAGVTIPGWERYSLWREETALDIVHC